MPEVSKSSALQAEHRQSTPNSGPSKHLDGPPLRPSNDYDYGVSLLIRVDQLPSAERGPGPWDGPAHVPSKLSPLPPKKNGPPQSVYTQGWAMYSLAIQIEFPSTAAAPKSPQRVRGGLPTCDL